MSAIEQLKLRMLRNEEILRALVEIKERGQFDVGMMKEEIESADQELDRLMAMLEAMK